MSLEIEEINKALSLKVSTEVERIAHDWLAKAKGADWTKIFEDTAKQLDSERSKVKVLAEALRFYAKGKHISSHPFTHDGEEYIEDRGTVAREALEKVGLG